MRKRRTPKFDSSGINVKPGFKVTPDGLLAGHFIGVNDVEILRNHSYAGKPYPPITSPVFLIEKVGTVYVLQENRMLCLLVLTGTDRERIELWLEESVAQELWVVVSKTRYYGGWGHKLWREIVREKLVALCRRIGRLNKPAAEL